MMNKSVIIILIILLCSAHTYAAEPDFYIDFSSCKTTVGYLVLSDVSIKTMDGTPTTMGCFRRGDHISCTFMLKDGSKGIKGNNENYKVLLDSPPLLYFETENGSEFVAVNTKQHAAVLTVRVLGDQYSGSKICQGLYTTSFEVNSLKKK